ncbi:hypothetical protein [Microbacterium foliorum]|nr:hypothetical protein [Microbacterium foliorum]
MSTMWVPWSISPGVIAVSVRPMIFAITVCWAVSNAIGFDSVA